MADPSSDLLTASINGSLDGADVYSAVAVLAAICNQSPVVFLNYPGLYTFKGLGLTVESHSLSHRISSASPTGACLAGVIDMLLKIDGYYAQKFAKLVGLLNDVPEGDGTTAPRQQRRGLVSGNVGWQCSQPEQLADHSGRQRRGLLQDGWAVNVDDGSANLSNGNSEALCNGVAVDSTGTDPALANARSTSTSAT
ncbi:MAG: hypothetical protein WDO74_02095 [Pseudomonadota bacterium]